MDRKIILTGLILALAAVVFLAGCTQIPDGLPQDPKEAYELLAQKSKEAGPMRIAYEFAMSLGQQALLGISEIKMDLEVFFHSQQKTKTLGSMSILGQTMNTAVYNLEGKTLTCTEGGGLLGTAQGMQCTLGEQQQEMPGMQGTEVKSLDELFSDYKISFAADKTFAGRKAKCFLLEYAGKDVKDQSQLGGMGTGSLENVEFTQEVCLDIEKGFASFMDVETRIYSELTEEYAKGFGFKMEMKSFSTEVTDADFEPPVAFSFSGFGAATCEKDSVSMELTPFKDISGKQATVKIGVADFTGGDMEVELEKQVTLPAFTLFEEGTLVVDLDEEIEGSKQVELCVDGECQSTGCYISDWADGLEELPIELPEELPELTDAQIAVACAAMPSQELCEAVDLDADGTSECAWDAESELCSIAAE